MTTDTLEKTAETAENWFSDDAATFGDRLEAAREAAGRSESGPALYYVLGPRPALNRFGGDHFRARAAKHNLPADIIPVMASSLKSIRLRINLEMCDD